MTKERKAPKDWETWEDFANCYDLVLFNKCTEVNEENTVFYEWYENHTCEHDDENEDCACECEPYQWYAIGVGEWNAEWLNKNFELDIFYSDTLGIYILPVYHFGTGWSHVPLSMNKTEDHD